MLRDYLLSGVSLISMSLADHALARAQDKTGRSAERFLAIGLLRCGIGSYLRAAIQ